MKIATAYDAYWFLHGHPKMRCRVAHLISTEEANHGQKHRECRVRKVRDDMPWAKENTALICEHPLWRTAIESNLDIFYAKVDKHHVCNDDEGENIFIECWLEFGPIKYVVQEGILSLQNFHDPELDCGAPTFDKALVKLAKLVRKHYGDYR